MVKHATDCGLNHRRVTPPDGDAFDPKDKLASASAYAVHCPGRRALGVELAQQAWELGRYSYLRAIKFTGMPNCRGVYLFDLSAAGRIAKIPELLDRHNVVTLRRYGDPSHNGVAK